jgi:hypothetical protein
METLNMKNVLMLLMAVTLFCSTITHAQIHTSSGFYYPVSPTGSYTLGYHRIGGMPSGPGFAGHFLSPSYQRTDPITNSPGSYFVDKYHNGMDVMASHLTPVYAIADGTVMQISHNGWSNPDGSGTTNVAVVISHLTNSGLPVNVVYGHLEASSVTIAANLPVTAGQQIGWVGTWYNGDHLHFGVHLDNGPLPFNSANGVASQAWGYGMIGIDHWVGTWPDRMNWVDPVMFIESNCPQGVSNCPTDDLIAKSDMKERMTGMADSSLDTNDAYFSFLNSDTAFEYRHQWFFKWEGSNIHWFEVWHATYINDRNVRYIEYQDYNSKAVFGWFRVNVAP